MTDAIKNIKSSEGLNNQIRENRRKASNLLMKKSALNLDQLNRNENKEELDSGDLRLKEVSKDFEKIFVTHMVKNMWKIVPMDESTRVPGENLYLEMIQSALANELVKGKGLGIADMLYKQIKNEKKQNGNTPINKDNSVKNL